jgi:hypothetical protein
MNIFQAIAVVFRRKLTFMIDPFQDIFLQKEFVTKNRESNNASSESQQMGNEK